MSELANTSFQKSARLPKSKAQNNSGLALQRKCNCGGTSKLSGRCSDCERKKLLGLQPKLRIGDANDALEQEADLVAERVMAMPGRRRNGGRTSNAIRFPKIQRQPSEAANNGSEAPSVVHDVLRSSGQPLDKDLRQSMENRFGHDFGEVRIHTNSKAVASAAAVNALAYTVGKNIVFGSGSYIPSTYQGQKLLAHELVHTIQQGHVANSGRLKRKGGTFSGFFKNIGRGIAGIFGLEPKYDEETLEMYLKGLEKNNEIEDDFDSDNKARAVVLQDLYKKQTVKIRTLLVKELLSGFTGNADEQAILTILENAASLSEREKIAEGVTYGALHDNFHTKEVDSLYALLPMMRIFHPREKKQTTVHSLTDYIKSWEQEKGRKLTTDERLVLAKGCIGITMLQLGRQESPKLTLCYGSFEKAWMIARSMNEYLAQFFPDRKAFIFSKRFWTGGEDYSPDEKTGEVDMSNYDYTARPGHVNFDYGFYDESTNKWWHANHCDPTKLGVRCKSREAREKNLPDPMNVYESNLAGYSRPLTDFDAQVFCIGVAKIN